MPNPNHRFNLENAKGRGKMKKLLLFVLLMLVPCVGRATTVDMVAVVNCSSTTNTTAKGFCDSTYATCSSSSPFMAQVTTAYGSLINTNYTNAVCGRIYSENTSSYWVLCFDYTSVSNAHRDFLCDWFEDDGGCNSGYLGTTPSGINPSANAVSKVLSLNIEQIQCCQTCTGKTYSDYLSGSVEREQTNTCSTSGTCAGSTANAMGSYYCNQGYYSAAGTTSVSNATNPNELQCTSCATLASGLTQSDVSSPLKSKAPTACYIPAGHSISDSFGTYKYTTDCNYTS